MTTGESGGIGDGYDMDEWQPASVALATPDAASRRTVVGGHFPQSSTADSTPSVIPGAERR